MTMDPPDDVLGITRPCERDDTKDLTLGHPQRGYRITPRAWQRLTKHHGTTDLEGRLMTVLDSLAPIACSAYLQHHVLVTNYDFLAKHGTDTLWYIPNRHGGITITLSEER